ncbi:uncharacterized protein BYT42DRAFT_582943 [Radiomyces spectabilis]|uniref:uncharacterized protein n=1 Tax=Radiomyces spectabilis TaxID=64574 RepID=UPI002221080B|nr:uncharacterized protein BYT42DRAFT_582943 [Radiomyces spectabilis]KAI8370584.1 hypothetical protein BYT42DRAFT_582943 [Radiomyces spectabilis]
MCCIAKSAASPLLAFLVTMPSLTAEFQTIVNEKASLLPEKPVGHKRKPVHENSYDLFAKEAYRIYQHIDSLRRFLLSIRRPYLSTDTRHIQRKRAKRVVKPHVTDEEGSLFAIFPTDIQFLTDRERDEIDFQAKLIIRRCMDRVKELEEAEKLRQQKEAQLPANRLAHFLSSVLISSSAATEDTLAVHRSSITWLLNKRLMDVSKLQKDQQEIRLTRQLEKSENQLHRTAAANDIPPPVLFDLSAKPTKSTTTTTALSTDQSLQELDTFEAQLSQEQLQVLEKENATMLEELNNTLNQVRTAEKALLEISTLQTQLTNHLAIQTIQTDKLYADAVMSTGRVEEGNVQLIKTRERNRGTRKFLLAFLIGASFVLLFLDWYS